MSILTCEKPDRHVGLPMVCGYPIPCIWHTTVMNQHGDIVVAPLTTPEKAEKLREIAEALDDSKPAS